MLCILALVILFSGKSHTHENCRKWKPEWSSCNLDSDCVIIDNPCGWPISASNKKYSEDATKCNRIKGASLSCVSWDQMGGGKRLAFCNSGNCKNKPVEDANKGSVVGPGLKGKKRD